VREVDIDRQLFGIVGVGVIVVIVVIVVGAYICQTASIVLCSLFVIHFSNCIAVCSCLDGT
jgi:hypothetical protein